MNSIQFPFQFDAPRIHQELLAIAASFQSIHSLKIKENHLRGVHLITPNSTGRKNDQGYSYQSTPELNQSPYLQSILAHFPCDKFMYRVHNLKAGGKIELHRDSDRGLVNNIVRIHIPVTTNDEIYFYVNGERICMRNGECWYADISQLHEVENRSNTDRLQLMIDCDLNGWWKDLLKKHGIHLEQLSEWNNYSLAQLQGMKENLLHNSANLNQSTLTSIDQAIALKREVSS